MDDIAPVLLDDIQKTFKTAYEKDKQVIALRKKLADQTATYKEANKLSIRYGELLSRALRLNLSADVLPDGRMYFNIADKILTPLLTEDYMTIASYCVEVQKKMNELAGVGLNAVQPEVNESRIKGFLDRISSEEDFDRIKWILGEPIVNYSQSTVDDAIKVNAEFQYGVGLHPMIVRTSEAFCCEWCSNLAGTYEYPGVPGEVFQRHENCRCGIEYNVTKLRAYTSRSGRSNTFRA